MSLQISKIPLADFSLPEEDKAESLLKSQANISNQAKIKEVSQEFESLFFDIVLKAMRQTVMKSELIDGGNAEEIYRGMLDSEYSKLMAKRGVTGLSEIIERQLLEGMDKFRGVTKVSQELNGKKLYSVEALPVGSKKVRME